MLEPGKNDDNSGACLSTNVSVVVWQTTTRATRNAPRAAHARAAPVLASACHPCTHSTTHHPPQHIQQQGAPFCICGSSNRLALFRLASSKHRFCPRGSDSAIGRVFAALTPDAPAPPPPACSAAAAAAVEADRVLQARRCRIRSTVLLPVYDLRAAAKAGAVASGSPTAAAAEAAAAAAAAAADGAAGGGGAPPAAADPAAALTAEDAAAVAQPAAVFELAAHEPTLDFDAAVALLNAALAAEGLAVPALCRAQDVALEEQPLAPSPLPPLEEGDEAATRESGATLALSAAQLLSGPVSMDWGDSRSLALPGARGGSGFGGSGLGGGTSERGSRDEGSFSFTSRGGGGGGGSATAPGGTRRGSFTVQQSGGSGSSACPASPSSGLGPEARWRGASPPGSFSSTGNAGAGATSASDAQQQLQQQPGFGSPSLSGNLPAVVPHLPAGAARRTRRWSCVRASGSALNLLGVAGASGDGGDDGSCTGGAGGGAAPRSGSFSRSAAFFVTEFFDPLDDAPAPAYAAYADGDGGGDGGAGGAAGAEAAAAAAEQQAAGSGRQDQEQSDQPKQPQQQQVDQQQQADQQEQQQQQHHHHHHGQRAAVRPASPFAGQAALSAAGSAWMGSFEPARRVPSHEPSATASPASSNAAAVLAAEHHASDGLQPHGSGAPLPPQQHRAGAAAGAAQLPQPAGTLAGAGSTGSAASARRAEARAAAAAATGAIEMDAGGVTGGFPFARMHSQPLRAPRASSGGGGGGGHSAAAAAAAAAAPPASGAHGLRGGAATEPLMTVSAARSIEFAEEPIGDPYLGPLAVAGGAGRRLAADGLIRIPSSGASSPAGPAPRAGSLPAAADADALTPLPAAALYAAAGGAAASTPREPRVSGGGSGFGSGGGGTSGGGSGAATPLRDDRRTPGRRLSDALRSALHLPWGKHSQRRRDRLQPQGSQGGSEDGLPPAARLPFRSEVVPGSGGAAPMVGPRQASDPSPGAPPPLPPPGGAALHGGAALRTAGSAPPAAAQPPPHHRARLRVVLAHGGAFACTRAACTYVGGSRKLAAVSVAEGLARLREHVGAAVGVASPQQAARLHLKYALPSDPSTLLDLLTDEDVATMVEEFDEAAAAAAPAAPRSGGGGSGGGASAGGGKLHIYVGADDGTGSGGGGGGAMAAAVVPVGAAAMGSAPLSLGSGDHQRGAPASSSASQSSSGGAAAAAAGAGAAAVRPAPAAFGGSASTAGSTPTPRGAGAGGLLHAPASMSAREAEAAAAAARHEADIRAYARDLRGRVEVIRPWELFVIRLLG